MKKFLFFFPFIFIREILFTFRALSIFILIFLLKGRTQLCALLLAHGADPTLKNQEGQTPLDLCSADDVKCLLQDAMPTTLALPTTTKTSVPNAKKTNNESNSCWKIEGTTSPKV